MSKGLVASVIISINAPKFSPLSGLPDKEENYHTLIYNLSSKGEKTILHFTQDNNPNENSRIHSEKNWVMIFQSLKNIIENR